jgi:hypothetical protein
MTQRKDRQQRQGTQPCRCQVCEGRGWLLCFHVDREVYEIQRCDACGQYDSDKEAGDAAAPTIRAALDVVHKLILAEVQKVRKEKGHQP